MFTAHKVLEYAESRQIKMITSSLYYAQANGQVEIVNKSIIALIKRMLIDDQEADIIC